MDKLHFIAGVARRAGVTRRDVMRVLRAIEEVSAGVIHDHGSVRIPGLVTIKREYRSERVVRNPRTGEEFLMGPSTTVKAKPTVAFSDRIKSENPVQN